MEILILSGKFGMGHWSAAQTLARQLERAGHRPHLADLYEYALPEAAPAIYRGFGLLVTYGGGLYNAYHRMTRSMEGAVPLAGQILRGLERLLAETGAAMVVSTHPTCSAAVSLYKERRHCAIPLVTCITDVTCHGEWLCPGTDHYLVASETVQTGLAERGVDPRRVSVTGIPVGEGFCPSARSWDGPRRLLIMGGGLGLMPRRDGFYEELNGLEGVRTTILCGKNEKLYRRLAGQYGHIEAVPFTNRVPEYMGQAHLLLSKPGGITAFEAIAARLPMLAWEPFLEQERENAAFLTARGMARIAAKEESACLAAIRGAIYDNGALASMERAMDAFAAGLEPAALCALVEKLARREVCA